MTQYSLAQIVRPDLTAMSLQYQGKSRAIPICWPGKLDPIVDDTDAGEDMLVAGTPVSLGARVMIWFPVLCRWADQTRGAAQLIPYAWRMVWRLRNPQYYTKMYQKGQLIGGYHFPNAAVSGVSSQGYPMVTVPAAVDVALTLDYEGVPSFDDPVDVGQTERPIYLSETVVQPKGLVLGNSFAFGGIDTRPLDASGTRMNLQQGSDVTPFKNIGFTGWNVFETVAKGDDLVILQGTHPPAFPAVYGTWDFTSDYEDKVLYQSLLDNPDFGVYVLTGEGQVTTLQTAAYSGGAPR